MDEEPKLPVEPGAPVPKDAIDPELIKLSRTRPRIGIVTAAGLVFLAVVYFVRLGPDRRFSGAGAEPTKVTVADVLDGKVGAEAYVTVDAEPLISHAIRATAAKGSVGKRVVPARGTGERLWIVLDGDGWDPPELTGYTGRLRKLADLPLATAVRDYAAEHPRPAFASPADVRAAFATGQVKSVTGEQVTVADTDRVAYDVVDPDAATIVCTLTERFPNPGAWASALAAAGLTAKPTPATIPEQARFELAMPNAYDAAKAALEKAELWAARVDPVTRHVDSTWGAVKAAPPPDLDRADLVGLYVSRAIPADAYALITDEKPDDYWYVTWIVVALGAVVLVFAWALVRGVKRDVLMR
ncbi:MAG TPA: hypothetical protein VMJ10_07175 [Kofleriaceae bacterium]|nr:hypothetical protein [Kofleriaceae bacterium]